MAIQQKKTFFAASLTKFLNLHKNQSKLQQQLQAFYKNLKANYVLQDMTIFFFRANAFFTDFLISIFADEF